MQSEMRWKGNYDYTSIICQLPLVCDKSIGPILNKVSSMKYKRLKI